MPTQLYSEWKAQRDQPAAYVGTYPDPDPYNASIIAVLIELLEEETGLKVRFSK